jgi:hypothetical protein
MYLKHLKYFVTALHLINFNYSKFWVIVGAFNYFTQVFESFQKSIQTTVEISAIRRGGASFLRVGGVDVLWNVSWIIQFKYMK